jgi:hypothetical protein
MLSVFNNETENGNLYISYPMIEALKDVSCLETFNDQTASIEDCKGKVYKNMVHERGMVDFQDYRKYDLNTWNVLIKLNIEKAKHFCDRQYSVTDIPSQLDLLAYQERLSIHKVISIFSAFPFFICDYLGSSKVLNDS